MAYRPWNVELKISADTKDHAIFKVEINMGTSWLTDKYRTTLIGGIVDSQVFEYGQSWNEETEQYDDDEHCIQVFPNEDEAIAFAKKYFDVTKIVQLKN